MITYHLMNPDDNPYLVRGDDADCLSFEKYNSELDIWEKKDKYGAHSFRWYSDIYIELDYEIELTEEQAQEVIKTLKGKKF